MHSLKALFVVSEKQKRRTRQQSASDSVHVRPSAIVDACTRLVNSYNFEEKSSTTTTNQKEN